ncbi:MAG: acetate--CoA ligase family protein, partial [Pseudomonadota bacterium]|nr:acetate--CoA ligase family protein [Pseudomonadota bacterium]
PGLHCWVGPIPRPYQSGALAFVAQSSAVAGSACNSAWDRGIGFSAVITTGNQCNFSLADALNWLAKDLDTRAIVCYIEQFADLPAFAAGVRRCRDAGKAVIAIATGRSAAARQITLSHTGALTAGPEASAAALEAMGVIQAEELDDALDYASLFVQLPPRAWRHVKNVGVVTASGGYSALAADALEKHGLACPPPPKSVIETLPEVVPHNNPMDLTATIFAWADRFPKVIDAFVQAQEYDAVAVMFGAWEGLERWFAPVAAWAYRANKPVFLAGNEVMALGDDMRRFLARDPMPVVHGAGRVARALAGMKLFHELTPRIGSDWATAKTRRWSGPRLATYPDLAPPLRKQGVTMAAWCDAADTAATGKLGDRLVVKLESPELLHKSDAGAVQIGVAAQDLAKVVKRLEGVARRKKLRDYRVIAQEQIIDAELELLVGAVVDDTVGPVLTIGLGGITAELQQRFVHALCPIDAALARTLIGRLGIAPLFDGYRGRAPLDPSLFDLLAAVSRWVYDHRDSLRELDLNPVFLRPQGNSAVAGDALAVFR